MNDKMRRMFFFMNVAALVLLVNISSHAQIHFVQETDWDQIKAQAKAEHKQIFVDCFASWCEPCKWMDGNVYNSKQVGDVYNTNFLCLRVQMDQRSVDSQSIKDTYPLAEMLEGNYHIENYPTYLFFDADGRPLHKATGSMETADFIRLASDVKNPDKQYYTLLKNFQPGTLDTTEERVLAGSFFSVDKGLAGKLATDYLGRLSRKKLDDPTALRLIRRFSDDPGVINLITGYLQYQPDTPDLNLLMALPKQSKVQTIAHAYIDGLPEDSLYLVKNIRVMAMFAKSISDRGFIICYYHPDLVNKAMKNGLYAGSLTTDIAVDTYIMPLMDSSRKKGITPDFAHLKGILMKIFNPTLAEQAVNTGKIKWFAYQVFDKKQYSAWSSLIDAEIEDIDVHRYDTTINAQFTVNNVAYGHMFLHSTTIQQLASPIRWLKNINSRINDLATMDTYACLLYKAGRTKEAITVEMAAINRANNEQDINESKDFGNTLVRMKRGEKIWLEKPYLN